MAEESKVQRVAKQAATVKRTACPACKAGFLRWVMYSPYMKRGKMQFRCDSCDYVEVRRAFSA